MKSRVTVVQLPHWLAEVAVVIVHLGPSRVRQAVLLLYALEFPVLIDVEIGRIVQLKEFSVDLQIEGAGIIQIDGGSPGYNTAPKGCTQGSTRSRLPPPFSSD